MALPRQFTLESIQQAFRDLEQRINRQLGPGGAFDANLKGKRHTNAGDAIQDTDLVTLRQLNDAINGMTTRVSSAASPGSSSASGGSGGGGTGDPGTCNGEKPDYTSYVEAAKTTLVGLGEDLTGACGAFKIVRLAAQNIQAVDNTVGLLAKESGNHCDYNGQGYSTDVLCFIDGAQYDVLQGAGDGDGITTGNTPTFNFVLCGDPSLYRAPVA